MISTVCILGDHIQSLGVARIAGRLGYKVIVMNSDRICITRFSKFCNKFILFKNDDELLRGLVQLYKGERDILLMPTNDKLVKFIIENYDFLLPKFYISTPKPDVLNICYNKRLTYKKALELNIPIPESYFPETFDQLVGVSKKIKYPVIIKPAVMHNFYNKTGKKVYICRDQKELLSNYAKAIKIIKPSEIIVQKLIRGRAKNLYSFCSFFADGETYGSFVAHRIRQKPMDFGISTTFAISVVNERIKELASNFLRGINYFGLSEVEFMYDPDDTTYKLIEINPRTWKWHSITNKLGINLIQMNIDYLNKVQVKKQDKNKINIGWIESVTDTYVVFSEILKGRMSFKQYLKTLRLKKEFACLDYNDLLPAIYYIVLLPYLFFTR